MTKLPRVTIDTGYGRKNAIVHYVTEDGLMMVSYVAIDYSTNTKEFRRYMIAHTDHIVDADFDIYALTPGLHRDPFDALAKIQISKHHGVVIAHRWSDDGEFDYVSFKFDADEHTCLDIDDAHTRIETMLDMH
jgi:hypothetical protein